MKYNIYGQAVLESDATLFSQTENIIDSGMAANDIQNIIIFKYAWEFILDKDVVQGKFSPDPF